MYDKATDELGELTTSERKMINELSSSPPKRIKNILNRFFESSEDKNLFFSRSDEIFLCYYQWTTYRMNPFGHDQGMVALIIEHLDLLKTECSQNEKMKGGQLEGEVPAPTAKQKSTNRPNPPLTLETLIKPFSRWNQLRKTLVVREVLTEQFSLNLKGKSWKKRTVFLINEIENKKYFDTRLSSYQVAALVKNSFNVKISREYVDKVYRSGEQTEEFKFIPESSQIS